MGTDSILDELHATRRKLLAEAGGTLDGLVADLRKRQQESGRKVLTAGQAGRLDVSGVETELTAEEIAAAVRESREREDRLASE